MTVYVCSDKDIECGDRPEGWCLGCPKRGLLQVAAAPHAAAHGGPTVMRPATPEEHRWLRDAVRRSSTIVRPRRATDEEVNEWAKRHGLNVWDRPSEARAAFEDAETHHMTRGAGGVQESFPCSCAIGAGVYCYRHRRTSDGVIASRVPQIVSAQPLPDFRLVSGRRALHEPDRWERLYEVTTSDGMTGELWLRAPGVTGGGHQGEGR